MKRILLLLTAVACIAVAATAQDDLIILRNGRQTPASIIQVNDREVIYKESNKKNAPELSVENSDVYMIHFAKRGNVYITTDGKRVTGENVRLPKDADIIYLVEGREIPAYELRVMEDRVSYLLQKNKNKNVVPIAEVLPRSAVFMVCYTDGTSDVLTDITTPRVVQPAPEPEPEPVADPGDELEVVFHNVKQGETLSLIANRYNVAITDIVKWNDLPASVKPTSRLRADMQLMLYVSPSDKK